MSDARIGRSDAKVGDVVDSAWSGARERVVRLLWSDRLPQPVLITEPADVESAALIEREEAFQDAAEDIAWAEAESCLERLRQSGREVTALALRNALWNSIERRLDKACWDVAIGYLDDSDS